MNADTDPRYLAEPAADAPPLPWSKEAEQSVLGGLLIDNRAFGRIDGLLQEGAFWLAAHRTIWAAIAAQITAGKPADSLTVFDALSAAGTADECGGLAYLGSLAGCVPSAANVRRYAEIVADKAAHRQAIAAADAALAIARESEATVPDKLDRIAAEFAAVQRGQMRDEPKRLGDLVREALGRYEDIQAGRRTPGMATGIRDLDRILLGGLRPGKVYCIAARPSIGKSSMARAIALYLAACGWPVGLLSQEMPVDEVADCAVAALGRVEGHRLQTGKLTQDDWHGISEAAERAASLPLYIDDEGGLTIAQIRAKARAVKGLKVLVVDYLQLSTSTLKGASTNDQVGEISKGLKQLSLQLGIAVVVLSQLSRAVENRADREPQLSDLRDSGAIEQDIDVSIMLWTVREPESGPRLVGCKVNKHRGGPKGRFPLWFDAPIYAWDEAPGESLQSAPAGGRASTGSFE